MRPEFTVQMSMKQPGRGCRALLCLFAVLLIIKGLVVVVITINFKQRRHKLQTVSQLRLIIFATYICKSLRDLPVVLSTGKYSHVKVKVNIVPYILDTGPGQSAGR